MRGALLFVAAMTLVTNNMKYPDTKRDAVVDDVHGVKIPDPYRWLEDASKPDVKAWMAAQDKLARGVLSQLPGRDKLIVDSAKVSGRRQLLLFDPKDFRVPFPVMDMQERGPRQRSPLDEGP